MTRAFLIGALALLSGCAWTVGPDYERPDMAVPETFSTPAPAEIGAQETAAAWWEGYGDAELTRLVEEGLRGNLDVEAAIARLAQAEALVRQARSDLFPDVDGGAGVGFGHRTVGGRTRSQHEAEASLGMGWTPDLFGGTRRAIEAARAEAQRREALKADVERLTAQAIVKAYIALRRDQAQRDVVGEAADSRQQTLKLITGRREAGLASDLDEARATADLASAQARVPLLSQSVRAGQAALDVLAGNWPGPAPAQNISTPPAIPVFAGGPSLIPPKSALLARPDVQAAEAELARATAEIGIAVADMYPSVSLPADISATAVDFGTADAFEELITAISLNLRIPLFDVGGRRAAVAEAEAGAQEALFAYRAALLNAARDAETALSAVEHGRTRRDALTRAEDASERAYTRARQLYEQGLVDFIEVLDTQRTLLDTRQDRLDAEADLAIAFADLYTAVGASGTPYSQSATSR